VKAYAHAVHGDSVNIRLFKDPEALLAACAAERPAVVGLSNYGWNVRLNHAIGSHIRAMLPDVVMVAGGPNIDEAPASRLRYLTDHAYVDYLVVGAGEQPFADLVSWLRVGRDEDNLPANVACCRNGELVLTESRTETKEIQGIPSPYLAGYLDEFLALGMAPLMESNRGCPFSCTFCAWGAAAQNLVRRFDLDIVLAEIAYVGARSKARNWIFCDANFGLLKRDVEIARAIRRVKDETGYPKHCHVWLAKNATERNLEIAAILEDMAVPVMAVQSMDPDVLVNIRRDNISTDTYVEYQRRFHALGQPTYSDMIVPLPGETMATHLDGLTQLFDYGVDIIQNHNMRLLAGAETNSDDTRARFGFQTRYRLIHGDAGIYRSPDGSEIFCFEYEESLRATSTMAEEDLFTLRKIHFLVDFAWNTQVYRPLLAWLAERGFNQVDVLRAVVARAETAEGRIAEFFRRLDEFSRSEWFDTPAAIEAHFADPVQRQRLLDQDLDKLNILFSVILLKEYKADFDAVLADVARTLAGPCEDEIAPVLAHCFALFPPLDDVVVEQVVALPGGGSVRLAEGAKRRELRTILATREQQRRSLSKILNTQSIGLSDLKLVVAAPSAVMA
ncbi:MAG: cobalamin-dependent protein, partial [Magnetospirillum sp.]|nr:cobalamin-dependent protein [Magnetospirillum sp.]